MTNNTKLPVWFWIISIAGLVWNLLGVVAYLGQAYMTDEQMALLPEADQNWYNNVPAWVTAAFAIAVFAGTLGCIALLLRKRWAVPLFMLSLIGVLAQQVYNFFLQDYVAIEGTRMIMPIVVILVAGLLYWYSKGAREKAWLT
ncbi:MAG: hypothetical protein KJP09_01515 [Bacteroidia bacterium]|nr:hypothetical protein [Bacteroidia bacterium]NND11992.1 hypothetical protein [Flavobacteriaceae bacterium]MBT8310318.1 hypothetical protein [Bacteroidia bacterium]NNK29089.1 hypothetical protein [Flavobacteriaceae bacterium]NNL59944.1 hypothetical protein [Flavobacteriaceae bacterium]